MPSFLIRALLAGLSIDLFATASTRAQKSRYSGVS